MKSELNLSIPTPCHEKWENFTPQADGGYCSSCCKTVVDFTKMSDEQIIDHFSNRPAHTCGRFRQSQLKKYDSTNIIKVRPGFTLFKAGVMSMLFMLISKQSDAGIVSPTNQIEHVQNVHYTLTESKTIGGKFFISGIVLDESGQPFPGINVVLKGTTVGAVTDSEGRFTISQEVGEGDVLVFSFIGYMTQEFQIKKDTPVNITMNMDEVEWMGEIVVDEVYDSESESKNLWSRLKSLF